ncbi:nucleoside phosphorylase [Clostridium beijerinckii]|nr:nucleoside phosphorylase [Clostridium beijerinckii]NSA05242.1 nucleoside phosphorylase [Clostridium beijerinckii]
MIIGIIAAMAEELELLLNDLTIEEKKIRLI